jgi:hypothetical protein
VGSVDSLFTREAEIFGWPQLKWPGESVPRGFLALHMAIRTGSVIRDLRYTYLGGPRKVTTGFTHTTGLHVTQSGLTSTCSTCNHS